MPFPTTTQRDRDFLIYFLLENKTMVSFGIHTRESVYVYIYIYISIRKECSSMTNERMNEPSSCLSFAFLFLTGGGGGCG